MAEETALTGIQRLDVVTRKTLKSAIFGTLRELILDLRLPPGERLIEAELAARFGVSKTPIREALLMLEQEYLVTIVPHVGATVTSLSIDDFEQHLFLQDALEQPAMPLIVERITSTEKTALAARVFQLDLIDQRGEQRTYHGLVRRLHSQLFSATRYARLVDLLLVVTEALRRYHPILVWPFDETRSCELRIIVERCNCLLAGDAAAAASAVQRGHEDILSFARSRLAEHDSGIARYLSGRDYSETEAQTIAQARACAGIRRRARVWTLGQGTGA
jgi:DNA-binding GntR family transcriptional regulator